MESAARPFQFPKNLSLREQIPFALNVIARYREELHPLRKKVIMCQTYHDPLIKEVYEWKEKYHKKEEKVKELEKENERLKKEIEKLTKTNNRYQVSLFDHGNFRHPDKCNKKPNGGQTG